MSLNALRQAMPFSNSMLPVLPISFGDIFLAMILALIICLAFWIISQIFKILISASYINSPNHRGKILQRCYEMFPFEMMKFKGEIFSRGMKIRVTTIYKKTFEGTFLGINSENIICVLTKNSLAADMIENVTDISLLEDADINNSDSDNNNGENKNV